MDQHAAPTVPAILLDRVGKRHGAHQALRDVSLAVGRGERVVLCGPSGSGKSTLIRVVNGLAPHDEGTVAVDGIVLDGTDAALARVRRAVGTVFQSFNLFPHMTVLENCALAPMKVRGLDRRTAEASAMALLERVRIPEQARKYPSALSGGQQQRVAIARALAMKPATLLLDEPTSALDPEMVGEVLDVLTELAGSGMTILCATHEMSFARRVADRVVFMDGGAIAEEGPPGVLFANPATDRLRAFLSRLHAGHAVA